MQQNHAGDTSIRVHTLALQVTEIPSRRSADGRPIGVPGAGGGARPSRQADHGVDVVPPSGSYFELTSFVSC